MIGGVQASWSNSSVQRSPFLAPKRAIIIHPKDLCSCKGSKLCSLCLEVQHGIRDFVSAHRDLYEVRSTMPIRDALRRTMSTSNRKISVRARGVRAKPSRTSSIVVDERTATLPMLYNGLKHEDREDVYCQVAGGLSFDLDYEKFSHLVHDVLGPRAHIVVPEETLRSLFLELDNNQNGVVSYLEYTDGLSRALLSDEQRDFLAKLFGELYHAPLPNVAKKLSRRGTLGLLQPQESFFELTPTNAVVSDPRRLKKVHLSRDRIHKAVFQVEGKNPFFPHAHEEALSSLLAQCFSDMSARSTLHSSAA